MKNIVLVGFMGTGKTVIARRLAEDTGMTYVSTDDLIETREGRTINSIFREDGEPYFRALEKEVVKEVAVKAGQVIDAGGGVVLDGENVDNLKKGGVVICLWAEPGTIYDRTREYGHRPLLNVDDPKGRIRDILEKRKPFYRKADFHIDTTDLAIDQAVERIKEIVNETERKNG